MDLKDSLRQLLKLSSHSGVGVLAWVGGRFIAILLIARSLAPAEFGVFAVVQSFAMTLERLFNAQAWQLVVKFGPRAESSGARVSLVDIARVGVLFDLLGAAATISLALVLVPFVQAGLNLEGIERRLIVAFCLISLFNSQGTWAGILRHTLKFWLYSLFQVFVGLGLVVTVLIITYFSSEPSASLYLFAWLVVEAAGYLVLLFLGISVLARECGVTLSQMIARWPDSAFFKQASKFALITNLSGSVRMVSKEWDVLIVSGLLNSAAAGSYKIGKQIASIPLLISDQFYYAIYPHLSRVWAQGQHKDFRVLMRVTTVSASLGALILVVLAWNVSANLVDILLGPQYFQASEVIAIYSIAVAVSVATFSFAPALVASGNYSWQLLALVTATIIFLPSIVISCIAIGVKGAAGSGVLFFAIWAIMAGRRLWIGKLI